MIKRDIILFGKPGSGKGTLAKNMINGDTGFVHMSTGDIFRQNMKDKTELGLEIIDVMEAGDLVNDELTCAIVEDWFEKLPENKFAILDGFPRTDTQLFWLIQYCLDNDRNIPYLVELLLPNEIIIERLQNRAIEQERKEDQDINVIKQRLQVYEDQTAIVKSIMIDYADVTKVIGVDSAMPPKKVYNSTIKALEVF